MNKQTSSSSDPEPVRLLKLIARRLANPIALGCVAATWIVTSVVGPFGTFETDTIGFRLFFWGVVVALSYVWGTAVSTIVAERFSDWSYLRQALIGGAIFSLTYWAALLALIDVIYGHVEDLSELMLLAVIVAIAVLIYIIMWAVSERRGAVSEENEQPAERPAAVAAPLEVAQASGVQALMTSLQVPLDTDLIRMEMADHYIHFHTSAGEVMRHMRFADAVETVGPSAGVQVHRSHWVAWAHVKSVEREGAKRVVVVSDGSRLPVARGRVDSLRAHGLIT